MSATPSGAAIRGRSQIGMDWTRVGSDRDVDLGVDAARFFLRRSRVFLLRTSAIISAGAALLRVAAFFQLFDGLQVVATGALRGAGDTRTPMFCHFTGYWVIGLPVGAVLCFHYGLGAQGLWMGLSGGLILIGIVLVLMWRRAVSRLRRHTN